MKAKFLLTILFIAVCLTAISQIPEYWYLDEVNPGQDISLYADGTNVQEGAFSCKMTLEQPEVPYLISDNFDVNAGDAYTFTIYYYDNDDRGTLKFYADFYDAEGNDIYGEDPVESVDADQWQELTWSSVVPDEAVEGYILIKFYDDEGYVDEAIGWVDNVSFVVNSENLVLNGSFESWPGVGIGEADELHLLVSPNPATDVIRVSKTKEMDQFIIRNAVGQVVAQTVVNNQEEITLNVGELSNGIYILSGYSEGMLIGSTKLSIR